MLKREWEDFFDIMEMYGTVEFEDAFISDTQKDAAAALALCLNEKGRVEIGWMIQSSGLSRGELLKVLEGVVFQDPEEYDHSHAEEEGWMLREQYLSGNILKKYRVAVKLNRKYGGRFEANVRALKGVLPEKVHLDSIGFCIGTSWIPEMYYVMFAKTVLGLKSLPQVEYYSALGAWKVKCPPADRNTIPNRVTYGTEALSGLEILEKTLNNKSLAIYYEVPSPGRRHGVAKVLDSYKTLAALEKQQLLQAAFREWIRKDPDRVKRLEEIYYGTYACHLAGRYHGGFLTLPDLNREEYEPHQHQKDAVARIILEKDVLLNHQVGSGKTGTIIMGIHERKRIGLSDRNLVVVPNNVLEAFEATHRRLYPQDRILVVRPEDFRPDCRQDSLRKILDGDYAAVYMAFSSFERLEMSRRARLGGVAEQIRNYRARAENASGYWEKSRLENITYRLELKLEKMNRELPPDEYITFDELDITTLAVDEAHFFKNISLKSQGTGRSDEAGASRKCDGLLEKVRYVRSHGGGVIFATGTPLTNSISDVFVLQTFLQPELLEFLHLDRYDDWVNSFATRQTGYEVDVDSRSYRVRTRFSSFHNLQELTGLFSRVCDSYSSEEDFIDLPASEGYVDVSVRRSPEQDRFIDQLVERTEMIRLKQVDGTKDNLLKVTVDGRLAALDIRLAVPDSAPDIKETKVYACARKVFSVWKDYPETAQLVFCDIGIPKKGFNIYDELKKHLLEMGVPTEEIAFVHDAKTDTGRRKLFSSVNAARVRVLIGSTSKLGTGVNVQKRLIAIHHLDIPWRPSDIAQREGRLIRQGNTNDKVFRFRYVTAGTFDAYSWQILENKQRFISQFMRGCLTVREVEDIDEAVLSYSEIKALAVGNPLLKTRIHTANELERLKIYEKQRDQELRKLGQIIDDMPQMLDSLAGTIKSLQADQALFRGNANHTERAERNALEEAVQEALGNSTYAEPGAERLVGSLYGFRIFLPADRKPERPCLLAEGISGNRYEVDLKDLKGKGAGGCVQRIEYALARLDKKIRAAEERIERTKTLCLQAQAEVKKGNPYTAKVLEMAGKLIEIDEKLTCCA
ncbi:MAG: helicase-related protein [Eubacteriales bacterium]|nr:helicase-related protein [Eubacteriales bacterium]